MQILVLFLVQLYSQFEHQNLQINGFKISIIPLVPPPFRFILLFNFCFKLKQMSEEWFEKARPTWKGDNRACHLHHAHESDSCLWQFKARNITEVDGSELTYTTRACI